MRLMKVFQLNVAYISYMSKMRDPISLIYAEFELREKKLQIMQSRGPYQLDKCLKAIESPRRSGKSTLARFGTIWQLRNKN